MNRFLWGGPFEGLSRDFCRPVVQQWTGLAFERGPAIAATPRAAAKRSEPIDPDADAAQTIAAAIAQTREQAAAAGVHSAALAIDTRAWELVRFTLWEAARANPGGVACEVLHLSAPHVDDLTVAPW